MRDSTILLNGILLVLRIIYLMLSFTELASFFFSSFSQDLDAALPLIEHYKDSLLAIGEVSTSSVFCLNLSFSSPGSSEL